MATAETPDTRPSTSGRSSSRSRGSSRGRGRLTRSQFLDQSQVGTATPEIWQTRQTDYPTSYPDQRQEVQRRGRGRGCSSGRPQPAAALLEASARPDLRQRQQPGGVPSAEQPYISSGRGWLASGSSRGRSRGRSSRHTPGTPIFLQEASAATDSGQSSHSHHAPANGFSSQQAGHPDRGIRDRASEQPEATVQQPEATGQQPEAPGESWDSRPPDNSPSQSRGRGGRFTRGRYSRLARAPLYGRFSFQPYSPLSSAPLALPSTPAAGSPDAGAASVKAGGRLRADAPAFQATHVDYPSCVVCCGDLKVASVGKCNHKDVCAICSLRMRLCYETRGCPLCKADLKEVVMTPWRPSGVPNWEDLQAEMPTMWTKPQWLRGVFVDNRAVPELPARTRPLSSELEGSTGRACPVCDPQGSRLFPSNRSLQRHLSSDHAKALCDVCLTEHRQFPLELEAFDEAGMRAHMATHPPCEFCETPFFGADELFHHMRAAHFTCHVCQQQGSFTYFAHADQFTDHLREEHFVCEEEACDSCFVAFASLEELTQHHQEVHARIRRMPRFDRSRARPIALSNMSPEASALPRGPRARDASTSAAQVRPRTATRREPDANGGRGARREGMRMIDDDLGLTGEAFPPVHGRSEGLPGPQPLPGSSAAQPAAQNAFPSLSSQGEDARRREPREQARMPRLVSTTRSCQCGRRKDHPVIPEGQSVEPLQCDAECERQKRRQQLASAFDIDAAHHTPVLERSRLATHPPELLLYAWHHRDWVANVERMLLLFLDGDKKRHSLPHMPKSQREMVHKIASLYGVTTQSYGQEPHRHVELFKGPESAPISNLLSRTAASMTLEEVEAAMRAKQGHLLRLTDVAPGTDLAPFFQRWEATVSGPFADGTATVRFSSEQALQDALTSLGGGLRGAFLIDRKALHPHKGLPPSSNGHPVSGSNPQSRPAAGASRFSNSVANGVHAGAVNANGSADPSGSGQHISDWRLRNNRPDAQTSRSSDDWRQAANEPQDQGHVELYNLLVPLEGLENWEDVAASLPSPKARLGSVQLEVSSR